MADTLRTITAMKAQLPSFLELLWSGGEKARINLVELFDEAAFHSLAKPKMFQTAQVGDWGHSVVWADGTEIGADRLWLETGSSEMTDTLTDLIVDYADAVANHDAAHDKAGPAAQAEANAMLEEALRKLNDRLTEMGEETI